jgi:capsular exopolysaccharide synthesis family protein
MEFRELTLSRMIDAIKQRWILGAILFVVVGSLLTLKMLSQQDVYESNCKLEFASSSQEGTLDNRNLWRYSSFLLQNRYLTSQRIIMKSDAVVDRAVEALELGGKYKGASKSQLRGKILSGLSIDRVPDSQIFLVRGRDADPRMAADKANGIAKAYIRFNYEKKIDNYRNSIKWLDEELAELKAKLEQSQRQLIEFIEREKITQFGSTKQAPMSVSNFETLSEIESLLQKLQSRKVEEEIALSRMRGKYLPAHPAYKKAESEIILLKTKIEEQENRLNAQRMVREKQIITAKKNEIEYSILKRDVEVNKEIYNALIKKHRETDISSALAQTDANIVQFAKPSTSPVYPDRRAQAILVWVLALVLALLYCVIADLMDASLRTPEDVEHYFDEPLLAAVLKGKEQANGASDYTSEKMLEDPMVGESFRVLRTNLNFSLPKKDLSRVIMVGSSLKGEGKSTVTFNLGMVTAELGRRTLVVDSDLRARKLSKLFGFDQSMGLTNVLIGEKKVGDVIKATDEKNLYVLPSGPMPPKPSTLLHSEIMEEMIKDLRDQFDEIIFDVPPLNIVIDGSIVASLVDGVVFVVEAGGAKRFEVRRAISSVNKVNSKVCGIVLNKVDMSKKRYAYGPYYGMENYGGPLRAVSDETVNESIAEEKLNETTNKISSIS